MKIGVIGAGTMGSGIAQAFAQTEGYTVGLADISMAFVESGKAKIKANFDKRIAKGKMTQEEADKILGKIEIGMQDDVCLDADLIIEVVSERLDLKKKIFESLDDKVKPECIFASNTSSLSITAIGAGLKHPVVGMHFFNPAPVMKLVEVIAGINTPASIVESIKNISKEIGKTPVEVNEAAGFVVNRLLVPQINEAAYMKMEGVATIAEIDTAMKLGANVPMGPLELGDFIGLDIVVAIMDVLYTETEDSKYRCCPLLRKMVRGGNLGCKSGKGFYDYADGGKVATDAK